MTKKKPPAGDAFRKALKTGTETAQKAAEKAAREAQKAAAEAAEKARQAELDRLAALRAEREKWFEEVVNKMPGNLDEMTERAEKTGTFSPLQYEGKHDLPKDFKLEEVKSYAAYQQLEKACREADISLAMKLYTYQVDVIETQTRSSETRRGGLLVDVEYYDVDVTVKKPRTGILVTVDPAEPFAQVQPPRKKSPKPH